MGYHFINLMTCIEENNGRTSICLRLGYNKPIHYKYNQLIHQNPKPELGPLLPSSSVTFFFTSTSNINYSVILRGF